MKRLGRLLGAGARSGGAVGEGVYEKAKGVWEGAFSTPISPQDDAAPAVPPAPLLTERAQQPVGATSDGSHANLANHCTVCSVHLDGMGVGDLPGMCTACGQQCCCACNTFDGIGQLHTCPSCGALIDVVDEVDFARLLELVHDGSPGRHTPVAQCSLGNLYYHGAGVEQNYAEAFTWYQTSAEEGYAVAQCNLGDMYYDGEGVQQDYAEAIAWYRKSAEQGYAVAQCNLGGMYSKGEGAQQDDREAAKWYRRAAKEGDAEAQSNLGAIYATGRGVEQDVAEALKWWQLAKQGC